VTERRCDRISRPLSARKGEGGPPHSGGGRGFLREGKEPSRSQKVKKETCNFIAVLFPPGKGKGDRRVAVVEGVFSERGKNPPVPKR